MTTIVRHAPLQLWRIVETFMRTLCNLFGNPEDIARNDMLTRKSYGLLLDWLRCAEAMLRRMLLIEASYVDPAPAAPRRRGEPGHKRQPLIHDPNHPENWRVSFRCFSSPAHGGSVSAPGALTKGTDEPSQLYDAWPVAERYEALIRAFNNPAPYATRLARRLRRSPKRIDVLLRLPRRHDHVFTPGDLEDIDAHVGPAERRLNSS